MEIKIINESSFPLPAYNTRGSSVMDLRADLNKYPDQSKIHVDKYLTSYDGLTLDEDVKSIILEPRIPYMIPTGLYIALPGITLDEVNKEGWGYEAQIRTKRLLATKGISIINSPGTIDPNYAGEVKIILMNLTDIPFRIYHGDVIAYLSISKFERIFWDEIKKQN